MHDITFLRHGRSLADDEQKCEGRYDSPLTEVGRQQAEARADQWKAGQVTFDRIICSPLQRAHTTAKMIGETLDVPVETDDLWMEIDNGVLAGLPRNEAKRRFPMPDFQSPFEKIAHGTGESMYELHARAILALQRVIERPEGKYLVVAHGGILNAVLRTIVGAPPLINLTHGLTFRFGDLGYLTAQYYKDKHRWVIKEFQTS